MSMSYAHVCLIANGTRGRQHTIHVKQLRATKQYLAESHALTPTTTAIALVEVPRKYGLHRNAEAKPACSKHQDQTAWNRRVTDVAIAAAVVPMKTPKKQSKKTSLMDLPFEIRQNVFRYLCQEEDFNVDNLVNSLRRRYSNSHNPVVGNSQLTQECLLMSLKTRYMELQGFIEIMSTEKSLQALDFRSINTDYETGFEAVRYLCFGAFAWGVDPLHHIPLSLPVPFALRCKNLTSVILTVQKKDMESQPLYGVGWEFRTPKMLRSIIGFDRLPELRHLKVIELQTNACVDCGYDEYEIAETKSFMQELTVSLQEEVTARGRVIRVHCTDEH